MFLSDFPLCLPTLTSFNTQFSSAFVDIVFGVYLGEKLAVCYLKFNIYYLKV